MKAVSTIFAAALALAFQGSFAGAYASSTGTGGHCTGMTVTDYVSSYAYDQTSSTAWVNITDGNLNFTTSATGCVMITFAGTGIAAADSPNVYSALLVRTLLDGNNLCVPAPYDDVFSEAVQPAPKIAGSITHICKNVTAGAHTLRVQFHSNGNGAVAIESHVLTVTHN